MKTLLKINVVLIMFAAVVFAACKGTPEIPKKHLGIATYSIKGLETAIDSSFKSLQDDGYAVMEISNYNANEGKVAGFTPVEYAALAEKYGMDIISSHVRTKFDVNDVEGTLAAWGKVFDDHKAMGCKYAVLPMYQFAQTVEGMMAECELLNKVGEEANLRGIKFGYHNHSMEFDTIPGTDQLIEDFLIANTDPEKVFFQMDVYWITQGGQDPVAYLQKYPDRFKVLHIKDDYVIGESGKINYEAIFTQFYQNGHEDWFVEIEEKMTEEQRAQMQAMMQAMRERQAQAQAQPQAPQQGGAQAQGAQQAPPPMAFPQRTPEQEAERLKTSLEAIKLSAQYLNSAAFVK